MATYGKGISIYSTGGGASNTSSVVTLFTVPSGCYAEIDIFISTAAKVETSGVNTITTSGRHLIGPGTINHVTTGGSSHMEYAYVIFQNS